MLTSIDLAYTLGANKDPDLANKLVMAALRDNPDFMLRVYKTVMFGVNPSRFSHLHPTLLGTMVTMIRANSKVQAVKAYREATGGGLKEGLDVVNALEAELNAQ